MTQVGFVLPGHDFWPDDLPLPAALHSGAPLIGHCQVTDAYVLARAHPEAVEIVFAT